MAAFTGAGSRRDFGAKRWSWRAWKRAIRRQLRAVMELASGSEYHIRTNQEPDMGRLTLTGDEIEVAWDVVQAFATCNVASRELQLACT